MRPVLRKLRSLRALPGPDRILLLQAAVALPLIALLLRVVRVRVLLAVLGWLAGPTGASDARADGVRRTRHLVGLAARHGLHGGTCLSRSATLWWLLRRQGVAAELRIGVRKDDDRLDAHAWVECGGTVIDDRPATVRRYTPFAERLTR
jgi:hypothetical protein